MKQPLEQLIERIKTQASDNIGMHFRNSFASACYFSMIGKPAASEKLLNDLFDQLGWSRRKSYARNIINSIHENAEIYAAEINANHEFNQLFSH